MDKNSISNVCDYKIADNCDGTLQGKSGTKHVVYDKPSDYPDKPKYKYACILCEMCFDED